MSRSGNPKVLFSECRVHGIRWNVLIAAAVVLLLVRGTVQSQSTFATITGTVTDSSGAGVPNATIVAKNLGTNIETKVTSNELGNYTVSQLKEGHYSLRAAAPGFTEFVVQDVVLVAQDMRRIDVRLVVGALATSVEVKGGATLIETETARISDTKGAQTIEAMPLNQVRNVWAFISLAPGVVSEGFGSSTVRFAGSQDNQSRWSVDGVSMSDGYDNSQMSPLSDKLEWIQEIKLDVANNTAEFGGIGQVTIISKSGTNEFHGSAYDYYRSPAFLARNPFSASVPTGVLHSPGVGFGGPVYLPKIYNGKNRTFFFFDWEAYRGSQQYLFNATVPTAAMQQGNFSGFLPGTVIKDPTTGQPFQGNIIPPTRINQVSQALEQQFYPLPNYGNVNVFGVQNYRGQELAPYLSGNGVNTFMIRVDQHISDRTSIFGRVSYVNIDTYRPQALPTLGHSPYARFDHGAAFSYSHTFTPSLIFESRWGMGLNHIAISGDKAILGPAFAQQYGLVGLAPGLPNLPGMLSIGWSGIGLTGLSEAAYTNPNYRNHVEDFQQILSWFHGRHNLKMGFTLERAEYDNFAASSALYGSETFSSRFTGFPYADFLLGIPTTSSIAFPPIRLDSHRWQYEFFVADDFKVSSKLTLQLGARYELKPSWIEKNNRTAMFDIGSGEIVVPDAALSEASPLFPTNYVGIVGAKSLGLPENLIRTDKDNIAPRIGIAYRPWGDRTVVRAGYGIFYNTAPYVPSMGPISPFVVQQNAYTNPVGNPTVILPTVFPPAGTSGPSSVSLPSAVNPNLQIPYSQQYNFTIEHQRWDTGFRISYIGTNTRQGWWYYNYNSPLPDTNLFVNKPRPFASYAGINYVTNGGLHDYNSLTLEAKRQMAKGLHFQASWVWARDITEMMYNTNDRYSAEDPFNRARDRGVSTDMPTHRVTANMLYQLPFGKGRHWLSGASRPLNLLAGGWELSLLYSYYSGQFLTPQWTGPDPTGTAYTSSTTPASVTIRPNQIGDPNTGPQTVHQWFNLAAFAPPTPGNFGTSAVGVIKGPGVNVLHAGLFKNIVFQERQGLRLRLELTASNVFNHPNWSNPDVNISDGAAAGTISGVAGVQGGSGGDQSGPRALRAGIRLEW